MITTALGIFDRITQSGNAGKPGPAAPAATGIPAATFGSVMGQITADAVGTLQGAEKVSLAALQGKADTREAVDAVMNAEQSLQAAISIRDKIVQAYLEVSRMAI